MSEVRLTDALLAKLAGWQAVKQARALVAAGRVANSQWQAPALRGLVQEGSSSFRAGLDIRSDTDADNVCTCRDSRQRGLICAHSVAVGLHYLQGPAPVAVPDPPKTVLPGLRRAAPNEAGEPLRLFLILPQLRRRGRQGTNHSLRRGRLARPALAPGHAANGHALFARRTRRRVARRA